MHSWHTDRCVERCLFEAHLSCAFGAALLQGPTQIICNTVFSFLCQLITAHTSVRKIPRLRLWCDPSSRGCSVGVSYRNVLLYAPTKRSRRSWCFSGILQTTLFLLFTLPHFADFSGGIEPFLADAFRSEDVDVSPLGEEPHEDAFAKDVSADAPAAVVALSCFRGG